MDKKELKRTLAEQFVPYDDAVQDKLEYLQSDNVFASPGNMEDESDLSLEDAFGGASPVSSRVQKNRPSADYVEDEDDDEDYDDEGDDEDYDDDDQPKKPLSMAEKIATLRGISAMPGDYIKNKR